MTKTAKPIPDGYHSITPVITVRGARKAIEFYKQAFGAEQLSVAPGPDDKVMHAEIKIGDSRIMLSDEFPEMGSKSPLAVGGTSSGLHVYTPDVDALWKRAIAAGATEVMPLQNQFWGDRYGKVRDPFGHEWSLATHIEDVSEDEMAKRMQAMMSGAK